MPSPRHCSAVLIIVAALAALPLVAPPARAQTAAATQRIEAETLTVSRSSGRDVRDRRASGRRALRLYGRRAARRTVRVRQPSRLAVRVRGRTCRRAAPLLVASVGGRTVLRVRVRGGRWHWRSDGRTVAAGRQGLRVRLDNPRRARHCRRAVTIDRLELRPVPREPAAPPAPAPAPGGVPEASVRWVPGPRTTWQWQLSGALDLSVAADMYDIDLFDNSADVVGRLHAVGRRAVCYFSAGSWEPGRPDAGEFPEAVKGLALEGWEQERWLDIRRLDVLGPIMERRLDLCRRKGFDGVEADNVDGYANRTGFPLTAADQLRYNRFLADAAHARGLSIGLKNDLEQAAALEPHFDFAIVEQCFQYGECGLLDPFARAGKAVFAVEYDLPAASFCAQAAARGFMAMRKRLALDAWREPCW